MKAALSGPLTLALALAAVPVAAQESLPVEFSGSVSVTTDYAFRGISQTLEEMAIQGGIDAAGPAGLYLGVWGSSLNFGETAPVGRAQAEIDVFGGIGRSVSGFDLDLGFVYYGYPGTPSASSYDFLELGLGASRDFAPVSTGVKVAWSPDYFAGSGSSLYLGGSLGVPVGSTPLSLSASLGQQTIEENDAFGTPDYMDWSAGASLAVLGVDVGASVIGTDLDDDECFGGSELCATRVVFSLSRGL